jgi:hypothetical protein
MAATAMAAVSLTMETGRRVTPQNLQLLLMVVLAAVD